MLKKSVFFIFMGLHSFLFAQINVVVSILPQQTFVEKIGGDKVTVTTMVQPGSDPHIYEPKASQMVAISKADIYFPIQIEFEKIWVPKFKEQNKKMQFIDMTRGVVFMSMPTASYSYKEDKKVKALSYEWGGIFTLQKGTYVWSFAKVGGAYADPKMKFMMLPTTEKSSAFLETYQAEADSLFKKAQTTPVKNGDALNVTKRFYALHFDEKREITHFLIDIKQSGNYMFFTEHMPFEFEDQEHFLKDRAKNDIEPIAQEPKDAQGHHHHGGVDPHIWTAPSNVKIMAKNIYDALVAFDEQNRAYYKTNYEKFLAEIKQTDKTIKQTLAALSKETKFMVFHPSWGYFAKEYGLVQLAVEVEGKEPKPKMLKQIIEDAQTQGIKAIFTQPEFSDKSTRVIADELKIKVIKETPLAKDWSHNLIKKAKAIANHN